MVQRSEYDQWVIDWIKAEKEGGRKCFDVKKSGNSYYVYYQTTRYNSDTKKREKVSGYLGKLVEGIGIVEPDTYSEDDEKISSVRYGLGIDTGGTYTDAVIVDLDDYTVVAKKKSPTMHHDLSIGLYKSVDAVFNSCDVKPSDISLVGISTTLATNSILEGQGGEVGLILIGWDPMTSVNFGEKNQVFIKGGCDSRGKAVAPMVKEEVMAAIKKASVGVDAIAISGLFANANPSQEKKVKDLAIKMTGLPVIAGHELSAALGIDLRAETAVLNGKLIPIVSKFFDDVEKTFIEKGINAPIMAYKGDGSVMTLDEARTHPVETILSGPAASAMGGKVLSGLDDCVMVDIGGTSTDIAIMDAGFPQIQFEGAAVGKWRTRVRAVDMYTVALGGDSRISLKGSMFSIGPERVIPLSIFAAECPHVIEKIMLTDIYDYYEAEECYDEKSLSGREVRVFRAMVGKGPMDSMEVMNAVEGLWVIDQELKSLVSKGAIKLASLTPTDMMVYDHVFDNGSYEGARAGIHAISEKLGMTEKQAAKAITNEIRIKVAEAVMTKMLDDEMLNWQDKGSYMLLRRMLSLNHTGNVQIKSNFKVPIIGLGAPSKFMMEDVGERLGTEVIFPDNYDVGNAVGAISSKIAESLSATIIPTPDYRYLANVPFMGSSYHTHLDTAVASAKRSLESFLESKVKGYGARNIVTSSKIKTYMATEGGVGNWEEEGLARTVNFVEIISRAIGDPPEKY